MDAPGGSTERTPLFLRTWVIVTGLLVLSAAVGLGQQLRSARAQREAVAVADDTPEHRAALARAHAALDDGAFESAFDRYVAVLAADGADTAALAHLGWVVALAGDADTGRQLIAQGLSLGDTDEARWMASALDGLADDAPPPVEELEAQRRRVEPTTAGGGT